MYLWRKRATNDWLQRHSDELTAEFGDALAIIERPDKAPIVQITVPTQKAAMQLRRNFGGAIEKLRSDWLKQFTRASRSKPLRVGSRLVVDRTPGPKTIVIPAETAFGTGEHATTAMTLRMLERVTRKIPAGWSMLDAGTGSGILAIAGRRFGANRIVAIDNDPLACSIAQRNARANGVRGIEFRTGDVLELKFRGKFNVITANLYSEILRAGLPIWARHLAPGGRLILSGILLSQERAVRTALEHLGFCAQVIRRRGKWIALLAEMLILRSKHP